MMLDLILLIPVMVMIVIITVFIIWKCGRKMARKRKTTKKMQETKNVIMKLSTSGIEIRTRQSISADEIGARPPYMYTTLCPDPRYRI